MTIKTERLKELLIDFCFEESICERFFFVLKTNMFIFL
ncbi:hypothetical protein EZS27_013492 [termite gut metagenome]|uniref:Uncharacterized protein n=1 Tax=termite gut metagenome TaxID=433724 RepID=A0A5J4RX32_9ZZZZ